MGPLAAKPLTRWIAGFCLFVLFLSGGPGTDSFGLGSVPVQAQTAGPEANAEARRRLLNATSLSCTFTIGTQTDWASDDAPSTRELPAPRIDLEFDRISAPTSSAVLRLDGTESDVFIFFNRQGLNILERAGGGAISLYTIFGQFAPGSGNAFMAVNSRHAALAFPFPSQRHGTCSLPE